MVRQPRFHMNYGREPRRSLKECLRECINEMLVQKACPLQSLLGTLVHTTTNQCNHGSLGRDHAGRLLLAILLRDLLDNPKSKYSWAQQVSTLLFRTIIDEDSTEPQMRTPLELAQVLGLRQAARQLVRTLCLRLFNEPNPDRINFLFLVGKDMAIKSGCCHLPRLICNAAVSESDTCLPDCSTSTMDCSGDPF